VTSVEQSRAHVHAEAHGKEKIMSGAALELGEIVRTEVRESSGALSSYSHDYPVDPSGLVRIPALSPIAAKDKTLTQLRDAIAGAMVDQGLFSSVTVNLTLLPTRVDFADKIRPGDKLFLRVLGNDGTLEPISGSYTVDPTGAVNLPLGLGFVRVDGHLLFEAEHALQQGLGGVFIQPLVVNVTRVQLG
jgi:protein involved in polysaccharide export with SLBB domain